MWIWFALVAALFSAGAAITEKKALFRVPALSFSFFLAAVNLAFSIPFAFILIENPPGTITLLIIAAKSFLGSISFLFVMMGIKRLQLSSALPLLVLTPGLVAVFAWILLNDDLTTFEVTGMFFLLAGTYLLQTGSFRNIKAPFQFALKNRGYLFIAGALTVFTVTSLLDKLLLGKYMVKPESYLLLQHIFMFLFFTLFLIFAHTGTNQLKKHLGMSWRLVIVVGLFTLIYRYSHIMAIKSGPVALALSMKRTSVFFATVIGGKLFKESNILIKSIAAAIMVFGAILIIIS